MPTPTDKTLLIAVGARVRRFRERAGLTQEKLAEAATLQPETISRIENGALSPSISTLALMARALQVPIGDILDGERDVPMAGLSPEERRVLDAWRDLDGRRRALMMELLRELSGGSPSRAEVESTST